MTIAEFHQVLSSYYAGLGGLLPNNHNPLCTLAVLNLCGQSPSTEKEVMAACGLNQTTASRVLVKLCKIRMLEVVGPKKRFGRRFGVTVDGRKQLADLEIAFGNVLLPPIQQPNLPTQPDQHVAPEEEPSTGSTTLAPKEESGETAIFKAYRERFPKKVDDYEGRRLTVPQRS